LRCGTAYFSAWPARRGAQPVGIDLTAAQLATARRCQEHFRLSFPLLEADAGHVPLPGRCLDLVISECGTSLWCDPARWSRKQRGSFAPGRLVFHTTSVLLALCQPGATGYAGHQLLRPQRDVSRLRSFGGGGQFHPGHSEWIKILRGADFTIDVLHKLYAQPGASTHRYYKLATAEGAQQWPIEIWVTHLTGSTVSSLGVLSIRPVSGISVHQLGSL